jgi:hypothetical protein
MTAAVSPVSLFYSYAHADEKLRDELDTRLSALKKQGKITGWHDREIHAGTLWEEGINTHLKTAQIILLKIDDKIFYNPHVDSTVGSCN